MANDLAKLAARIAALEHRLSQQTRTSRLAYSSLEDGAVEVYDAGGSLRAVIGQQPDGTSGVIAVNGPRPPAPSPAAAAPVLGGLRITWDGTFADANAAPLDLSRVQVHLLTRPDGEPDVMAPAATIEAASGASVTIATGYYQDVWVRLVAVNTSGTPSLPSAPVRTAARRASAGDVGTGAIQQGHVAVGAITTSHLAVGSVTPDQIAVGQGTNLIPDPGFEGAVIAAAVAAAGAPWALAPGNRTGVAVRVDCLAPTPTTYTLPLVTVPVLAGTQLHLAVDVLTSEDLNASAVKIMARWEDSAGTVLGYGAVETAPTHPGMWQRLTGQVAAPPGTTRAQLALQATAATRGWCHFDNSEAHTIFGRIVGGARAELGPDGLRLFDEYGEPAVALVTGAAQYLTLRSNGQAVATIDTDGGAHFGDVDVAGDLTVGGDPVSALLSQHARGLVAVDYQSSSVRTAGGELGCVELAFEADPARMYRIAFDAIVNPSTPGGEVQLRLRDGGAEAPTVTSPQLQLATHHLAIGNSKRVRLELVRSGRVLGAGLHRLLITFRNQYGPEGQTVDLYGAASSHGLFYVEDIGAYLRETGRRNTGGGSSEPPVRTYTKTYTATWSGTYSHRSGYNAYWGNACVQGFYPNNGMHAALVGFSPQMATDLAGATIERAEVFLYFEHWYSASGGTAVIRAHSHASRPAKFSCDPEGKSVRWRRNQGQWVDISSVFDSTRWRGIALDPNTTTRTHYGRARGVGQQYAPKLRITYTK
ncbi:hypothetical protein [Streptomyces sp. CC224B]|uniref:hypothetical protein n=1 Tax=Streptomyces sp. CC224B TaxID=3044571 RepID=UPI0024A8B5A9|nr:hypothetical protein [Streptomyces sp. CC224B]